MDDDVKGRVAAAASGRSDHSADVVTVVGVGFGGAIGATLRWLVGEPFRSASLVVDTFPWSTFVVNVVGCLLIGVLSVQLPEQHRMRPILVTGVLGGFTTMSAFAVELNDLADASRNGVAATYLVATLAAGAGAVLLGEVLGGRPRAAETGDS